MLMKMNGVIDILKENCRTCLSYFDENNGKCSLMNCLSVTPDFDRLQVMKSVMTSCSLTLFTNKKDQEISETFICRNCVHEIDQMLAFLQKCIHSEAILKEASEVKTEYSFINNSHETKLQPKVEIKVENCNLDGSNCVQFENVSFMTSDVVDKLGKNNNESPELECQECHKTFPSALSLTFHRYKHPEYKPHTCVVCHENFRMLHLMKNHMAAEHESECLQQCRQCPEVFTSRHHLNLHEQRIHSAKKFSCGACKRTFSTISSLKFHENIHLNQPYSCTLCSVSFTSAGMLRSHKATVHAEPFRCHCGRSFNRKKKLELHVEAVHEKKEKSRKYTCPECEKKFRHSYALKNHLNTHLGVKPFLCNACGSAFTTLSNLRSHLRRIHSGEKQPAIKKYLCHTCGDSFSRASHLQRHTLRKHVPNAEKKHECPICKKKFLEKSDVTGHVKLHDDVKPFVCDQCSKCFRTAWRLQAHVKWVHLGLRPFECPTCSVKFKTKSHLEKHIRTHTGEKPFPCPHCAYTCAEKSNLKKHINIHLKAIYNIRV